MDAGAGLWFFIKIQSDRQTEGLGNTLNKSQAKVQEIGRRELIWDFLGEVIC